MNEFFIRMVINAILRMQKEMEAVEERAWDKLIKKQVKINMSLNELLSNYALYQLIYIARVLGVKYSGKRKKELIEDLSNFIRNEACNIVKQKLDKDQLSLIKDIINSGGAIHLDSAERKYGKIKNDSPFWQHNQPKTTLVKTLGTGIVYVGTLKGEKKLIIPRELLTKLRKCNNT